ncbi:proteinprecursor [Pasteurella multocida]|uniref:proteinprecursor n=1 Tax=Pasteurella multocida TaxID=747 RepID=UPI000AC13A36|nr:proteinprecursor [Pasteurella multocida]WND42340.1 proteinprecursor [Pasteurella multocida]
MLPYAIGLFFAIFDSATIGQVFFWGLMTHLVAIVLYFVFRYPLTAIWGFVVGITA